MTDEQINKAIAESIGWKWVDLQEQIGLRGVLRGYTPNVECVGVNQEYVTDYCNDLNAMHEAEKMLTEIQCAFYRQNLQEIITDIPASMYVWHATARQRAVAFLKTLNLWEQ